MRRSGTIGKRQPWVEGGGWSVEGEGLGQRQDPLCTGAAPDDHPPPNVSRQGAHVGRRHAHEVGGEEDFSLKTRPAAP